MKIKLKYKIKLVDILIVILMILSVCVVVFLPGCTNFKATMPDGTEILYQKGMPQFTAKKAELYYVDPNTGTVLWIIIDDPNSSVNPGGFKIKEPKTGIELSGTAE